MRVAIAVACVVVQRERVVWVLLISGVEAANDAVLWRVLAVGVRGPWCLALRRRSTINSSRFGVYIHLLRLIDY